MGVDTLELGPYTEGVNLVDPKTKLTPRELRECLNLRIGPRGEFYKRPGHGEYGSGPADIDGAKKVNLLIRYYKSDGSKKLIAGTAGGKLKFGNDVTGAWTQIDINGGVGNNLSSNLCDWMVYKDRVYITDGVLTNRYNNSVDVAAGHFVHGAPTAAPNTSGSMALGTYKYFVTSVAGNMGEGPKGAEVSITLVGVQDQVDLSAMAAAPAQHEETTKRIYRTKVNGTLFYFLAEIATGVTVFSDTLADGSLGDEFVPTEIPPATARFCIMGHDERAYYCGMPGADASLVRVSEVGFPDRLISASGFFTVSNNDGDIINGVGLVPGGLVFFKRTSMWLLRAFGFGLVNVYPKEKRGGGVGTISPFSVVTTPVGLIFLSQQGEIYLFDGTNVKEIGREIASEFKDMPTTSLQNVVACYHDYRYQISYDYKGTKGYNSKTLEYDVFNDKWEGPHENGTLYTPSYYAVWDTQLDKGELYWGESRAATGSRVYGRSSGTLTDRGNKFVSRWKSGSKPLGNLGEVNTHKVFVHGEFTGEAALRFSHINEAGAKDSVDLSSPSPASSGVWELTGASANKWGPSTDSKKWGGSREDVLDDSLGPDAKSKTPTYELTDNGTAVSYKINEIRVLAEALPLK